MGRAAFSPARELYLASQNPHGPARLPGKLISLCSSLRFGHQPWPTMLCVTKNCGQISDSGTDRCVEASVSSVAGLIEIAWAPRCPPPQVCACLCFPIPALVVGSTVQTAVHFPSRQTTGLRQSPSRSCGHVANWVTGAHLDRMMQTHTCVALQM